MSDPSVGELVDAAVAGDRRATGRLLTVVERGGAGAEQVAEATHARSHGAAVVGITGAPGSGKSTLVGRMVAELVERGRRPAVLAVDPSSPLSGGAILGDRVRMVDVEGVAFIRSVATRGHAGGLSLAVPGGVRVLDAAGFDPVIIETVGVGQVEVDVSAAADTTVVVVTPGMGDAVQANKAGLLEVADLFVVNKADQPGADHARRDLDLMLDLSHLTGQEHDGYRPPILTTAAIDGDGVSAVVDALDEHRRHLEATGEAHRRRHRRARFEVASRLEARFGSALRDALAADDVTGLVDEVVAGTRSTVSAAEVLAGRLLHPDITGGR